jgi:hypothetical protein
MTSMGVHARCPSCDAAEIARYERVIREAYCGKPKYRGLNRPSYWVAVVTLLTLSALLLYGCGATVTVNILSSHSRYGQAVGGTNTTIRGQIEGGGNAAATVPLP